MMTSRRQAPASRYRLGDLLTFPEVCHLLRVPAGTLRHWVFTRRIPFTKLHGRLFFSRSILEALLEAGAVSPVEPLPLRARLQSGKERRSP